MMPSCAHRMSRNGRDEARVAEDRSEVRGDARRVRSSGARRARSRAGRSRPRRAAPAATAARHQNTAGQPPARRQERAGERRGDRHDAEHDRHARQQPRRLLVRVEIAHDRARRSPAPLDMPKPCARRAAAIALHRVAPPRRAREASSSASARRAARACGRSGRKAGPRASWPPARPRRYVVSVSCAALTGAPSARASTGSDGTNRSVPSAGSAIRTPSSSVRRERGCFLLIQVRIPF